MSECIRVLVVDDFGIYAQSACEGDKRRSALRSRGLRLRPRQGVQKALELQPDVITLDVEMPVLGGLASLRNSLSTILGRGRYAKLLDGGGSEDHA